MKQQGKYISGNHTQVNSYTAGWESVRIHPTSYYRRQDEFLAGLTKSKGLYAELDMGQFVVIRFSEKDDMTAFHQRHHTYV